MNGGRTGAAGTHAVAARPYRNAAAVFSAQLVAITEPWRDPV